MVAESIGKYLLVRVLAEGGMGTVYLARDPVIGRLVAIKVLRVAADGPSARVRLLQEARAAGRLTHPNIVSIFEADEERGHPYIVMEYVEGQTLAAIIRDELPLSLWRKLLILERVCSALACAHEAGLVHRDIKPTNIIVDTSYEPRVLDFGLAKFRDAHLTLTGEHAVIGTLAYMAPEQLQGGEAGPCSDLYGVAAVAYELVTGRRAFTGRPWELVERLMHRAAAPPPVDLEGLDPAVAEMLLRGLDPREDHRFPSAREFEMALREIRLRCIDGEDDSRIEAAIVPQMLQPAPSAAPVPDARVSPIRYRPMPPPLARAVVASLAATGLATIVLFAALNGIGGPPALNPGAASGATPAQVPTQPARHARTLAAGTTLRVGVLTRLDGRTLRDGDAFAGVLLEAVVTEQQLLLPSGTRVEGRVARLGTESDSPSLSLVLTALFDGATRAGITTNVLEARVASGSYDLSDLRFRVNESVNLESRR